MGMELIELLPELVELAVFGLSTSVLSLFGAYLERFAFITIQSGDQTIGLWAGIMGGVLLMFAYLVGTDKFLPALVEFKQTAGDLSD